MLGFLFVSRSFPFPLSCYFPNLSFSDSSIALFLPFPVLTFLISSTSLHFHYHSPVTCSDLNMFFSICSFYSFSFLVTLHPPDPNVLNSQAPPAQTFHQISQDSPSHSAAQMRCSKSFLVVRIPLLVSLVSEQCTCGLY